MKILLVDDDDLILASVPGLLEVLGHEVDAVDGGMKALARLDEGHVPDLVIMDVGMPGLGGVGTLKGLKALRPDLPVLLATGRVNQAALDLVGAHSQVALLAKPYSMKELQQNLAWLLRV